MTTIISGTNRPDNMTIKIATAYQSLLAEADTEATLLSMEDLPPDFIFPDMYSERKDSFRKVHDNIMIPSERFFFIVPEYNGSFPGVLKAFIDACDVVKCFHHKKACLTGVASGRAGNLRGMDHLTGVLQHLKMHVHPNKLPISQIENVINSDSALPDESTIRVIRQQIAQFMKF